MTVFLGAIKSNSTPFVFSISEIVGISENTGMPILGKKKLETVKRVSLNAANEFIRSKYSYKKTGKEYFIEREK
jgi:hypothetical protein